jgi:hypothetical protein
LNLFGEAPEPEPVPNPQPETVDDRRCDSLSGFDKVCPVLNSWHSTIDTSVS